MKSTEEKHADELKRQENVFAKAQHDFNVNNDNLRKQLGSYENEISAKNHTLRRLEDECSQLRIDAGQFESKLESLHSEMASLDSAMASLHGEISVLQRELDESENAKKQVQEDFKLSKKAEASLSEEVATLRKEKGEGDQMRVELELQLAECAAKMEANNSEVEKRIQGLLSERDAIQANFMKKEAKLKQQSVTNQELNELVSKMHGDLMREKQNHGKATEELTAEVEELKAELSKLRVALKTAEEASEKSSRLHVDLSDKHSSLKSKFSSLQRDSDSQVNENKKLVKRIDRLEREKQDLLMEISSKAQACKDVQQAHDVLKTQEESALGELNEKEKLISQMKMELQSKESEIRQMQSEIKDKEEQNVVLERQLNEERKLKESSQEAARTQQRDHAARIVESNQKNSRLGSDLTAAQSNIDSLKKQIIDASSLISTYEKEKEELMKRQASTHSKLQALEDKYEECAARLEASDAELDDVKHKLSSDLQAKQRELEEKERHYNIELTNRTQKFKKEVDDLQETLKSTKRQGEVNMERALSRARNAFQRQLEDLQTSHHREISDARNRVTTVATAMESLQRELADECSKSSELMAELDMLRELTETKSTGAEESLARLEKDRTKERNNFEKFITNLRNEVKAGNKTASLLQQQLDAATQQMQAEKDERKKAENRLCNAEDSLSKQAVTIEELESEILTLKRQISENDKKVGSQLQQKLDEIQRVTRRNEVLSEAVTRLTQMNSSDGSQNNAAMIDNKYIFDDAQKNDFGPSKYDAVSSPTNRNVSNNNWDSARVRFNYRTDNRNGGDSDFQNYNVNTNVPVDHHMQQYPGSNIRSDSHNRASRSPTKHAGDDSYQQVEVTSPRDVNSSMLRVQQALDSRRKQQQHQGSMGSNIQHVDSAHNHDFRGHSGSAVDSTHNSSLPRSFTTPDRSSNRVGGNNVPQLVFNEYEKEIAEDRSPPSTSKDGGLFAVRIREEVEQGKDRLLPFSPKSASKSSRAGDIGTGGSKTERDNRRGSNKGKPDRALSAPAERKSRENLT